MVKLVVSDRDRPLRVRVRRAASTTARSTAPATRVAPTISRADRKGCAESGRSRRACCPTTAPAARSRTPEARRSTRSREPVRVDVHAPSRPERRRAARGRWWRWRRYDTRWWWRWWWWRRSTCRPTDRSAVLRRTVGYGGAHVTDGGNSTFGTITAIGGGAGRRAHLPNGGSGGGAESRREQWRSRDRLACPGQCGGMTAASTHRATFTGAGGGGAGSGRARSTAGGAAVLGEGRPAISGDEIFYAVAVAAAIRTSAATVCTRCRGHGGGGAGGLNSAGHDGVDGTGGGGGGGGGGDVNDNFYSGGHGAEGVVIVSYTTAR